MHSTALHATDRIPAPPSRHAAALPTRHLDHEGGRIAFDDTGGDGPLVLAMPGMGDLRSQYRLLRPLLVKAGCRVVTLDVRGHGESSVTWDDYSAEAVARDALALLAHLSAGPAVLVGNSFAAGSALWARRWAPERVRALVLLGPIVRDGDPPWWMKAALALGFAGPWRVAFWMAYWDSLFPLRPPADHAQARAALAANLREHGRMRALRTMVGLSKARTEAMLAPAGVAAQVIMGGSDPDFPDAPAEAHWLAQRIGAACRVLEGVGHYPQVEAPEAVADAVLQLLRETAPTA